MEAPSPGNSVVSLRRCLDRGLLHVAGLERRLTALSTNCHQVHLIGAGVGCHVNVAMNALMLMNSLCLRDFQRFSSNDSAANGSVELSCAVQNKTARMPLCSGGTQPLLCADSAGQMEQTADVVHVRLMA
jgi:hypothetical protein